MPLVLPDGLRVVPASAGKDALLGGNRVLAFRFEVLDRWENLQGVLQTAPYGGELSWSAQASIKSSGTLPVVDPGWVRTDWVTSRIRPVAVLSSATTPDRREVPLGVYLTASPDEVWSDEGRRWDIDLLDKAVLLDQDTPTDAGGNATAYTAAAGSNVVALVVALIQSVGESVSAIEPGSETLQHALVFEPGTTKLRIVNELLDAGNYFSLWVDGHGQFRVTKYRAPADRVPAYEVLAPFTRGAGSLMAPGWTRQRDAWAVPNRVVAVSQGDGAAEGMVATASNMDPASPFSYPSRGRWVTQFEEGVEATGMPSLQAYADRKLLTASSVSSKLEVSHAYLPDLAVNSAIQFRYVQDDVEFDMLTTVQNLKVPLDPTGLCTSTLREVVG